MEILLEAGCYGYIMMGLDVAGSAVTFFIFSLAEIIFILIPLLIFKLQKKDLRYEFRHRIVPNEQLKRKTSLRIVDVLIGFGIGFGFYFLGSLMTTLNRTIIILWNGEDYYQSASAGSVNTTPPPPPPDPLIIWCLIVIGVILFFTTVAVSEEFCFRGVIMKEIGHKSKFWAVIISGAFFMLYHVFPGIVPWATFLTFWSYYFIFGVLLALITIYRKGDLIIPIIAHGTLNSIIWVVRYIKYLP
ncbi:MAG: lysostaphin resistance A-like protein [Promethearchaeota archaeon]